MITKYDVASIVTLSDLDNGEWQKMRAATQRELFGAVLFGRKSVLFDSTDQGTVRIATMVAFGADCVVTCLSYEQFAECINRKSIQ